jgi:hypothetical protein
MTRSSPVFLLKQPWMTPSDPGITPAAQAMLPTMNKRARLDASISGALVRRDFPGMAHSSDNS